MISSSLLAFKYCLFAEDSYISLCSPDLSPQLQTSTFSCLLAGSHSCLKGILRLIDPKVYSRFFTPPSPSPCKPPLGWSSTQCLHYLPGIEAKTLVPSFPGTPPLPTQSIRTYCWPHLENIRICLLPRTASLAWTMDLAGASALVSWLPPLLPHTARETLLT